MTLEVSKLGVPFLMVNGNFRNLESLTVGELETFIPFMTKCSLQTRRGKVINGRPEWWIPTIQCRFPLRKPKGLSENGYRRHLQSIVCKCYCFHDAHFLLNFSSRFSKYPHSIFLRKNENNTTSIFSVENAIEIFTFENDNEDYDKKYKDKPYKSLLPLLPKKSNSNIIPDIYLCENCDVEFHSLLDIQRHETQCYGTTIKDLSNEIEIIKHIKPKKQIPFDKNTFLDYFGLQSKLKEIKENHLTTLKNSVAAPAKRWVILNICLHKNRKIEFSSLLGRKMLERRVKRDVMNCLEISILEYEFNCSTKSSMNWISKDFKKPICTYKNSMNKQWAHTYCFNKSQRMQKLKTILTGLNERSRKLLKKCKELRVRLRPLVLPDNVNFVSLNLGDSVIL